MNKAQIRKGQTLVDIANAEAVELAKQPPVSPCPGMEPVKMDLITYVLNEDEEVFRFEGVRRVYYPVTATSESGRTWQYLLAADSGSVRGEYRN